MEKICETCYFYHIRLKICMDPFSENSHTEVRPQDTCPEWTECEIIRPAPGKDRGNGIHFPWRRRDTV